MGYICDIYTQYSDLILYLLFLQQCQTLSFLSSFFFSLIKKQKYSQNISLTTLQ